MADALDRDRLAGLRTGRSLELTRDDHRLALRQTVDPAFERERLRPGVHRVVDRLPCERQLLGLQIDGRGAEPEAGPVRRVREMKLRDPPAHGERADRYVLGGNDSPD